MPGNTILSYEGPISFSTVDRLLSEFKLVAQDLDIPFKSYKKMISIMIEALENITKYSDQFTCSKDNTDDFCPSCFITRNGERMAITTKNPIKNRDIKPLSEKIDNVNKASREELKMLYKTTITNGKFSAKGGAGLGFIEMAKTSGNKLEYFFNDLSSEYSLYTFKVSFGL